MNVKEVMSGYVQWISPEISISEVAHIMRDNRIGCVPVGENDRLVGMITDRDITCRAVAAGDDLPAVTARDVTSKGCSFASRMRASTRPFDCMREKEVHHLTVLNRQKRMVGVVSLGDLALRGDQATRAEVVQLAARDAAKHKAA